MIEEIDKALDRARKQTDKVKDPQAFKAIDGVLRVLELMFLNTGFKPQVISEDEYHAQVKKAALKVVEDAKAMASKAGEATDGVSKPKIGGKLGSNQYL